LKKVGQKTFIKAPQILAGQGRFILQLLKYSLPKLTSQGVWMGRTYRPQGDVCGKERTFGV
jgi:hypothetical protein